MSYTHYWTTKKLDKPVAKEILEDALDFVKELSWHEGIRIGDGLGEGKPKIEHGFLAFNGYGEEDSYESFCLELNGASTFCKTAHRPYDTICVAMLVWAWKRDLLADLNSDGNIFDWLAGIKAYNKLSQDFTSKDYKKLAKALTYMSEPNSEVHYSVSKDLKPSDLAEMLEVLERFTEKSEIELGDEFGRGSCAVIKRTFGDYLGEFGDNKVFALVFNGKGSWTAEPVKIYAGAVEHVSTELYPYKLALEACLNWLNERKLLDNWNEAS